MTDLHSLLMLCQRWHKIGTHDRDNDGDEVTGIRNAVHDLLLDLGYPNAADYYCADVDSNGMAYPAARGNNLVLSLVSINVDPKLVLDAVEAEAIKYLGIYKQHFFKGKNS